MDTFLKCDLPLDNRLVLARLSFLAEDGHRHFIASVPLLHVLTLLQHREHYVRRRFTKDALRARRWRFATRNILLGGPQRLVGKACRLAELSLQLGPVGKCYHLELVDDEEIIVRPVFEIDELHRLRPSLVPIRQAIGHRAFEQQFRGRLVDLH